MARVQWIGGPTVLLELGGVRILTDPMFGEGSHAFTMSGHPSTGEDRAAIARLAPLPPIDTSEIDLVVVSHLHTDHFDPVASERLDEGVRIVAPADLVARLEGWGFHDVGGLAWGGEVVGAEGAVHIRAVPARHSADPAVNEDLGTVNGYIMSSRAEDPPRTLYWTGDTVWFDGLVDIAADAGNVDLLLVHLGAVGRDGPWGRMTMDAAEGARLVRLLEPAHVVPIHHHTFSHYVEPVDAFVREVERVVGTTQVVALDEGGALDW